ncbi:hypothetical protein E2C01_090969 [Portunus trituberculatus]|uniref:Uncharacterized protein n=1 Tax=Portunus trituberculatus TaxID=210409 RepID=A0A5B7JTU1_PORTR|nr:hypothetical protein [Portunus trituberculatus]
MKIINEKGVVDREWRQKGRVVDGRRRVVMDDSVGGKACGVSASANFARPTSTCPSPAVSVNQ